jgi:hypothetical protein
MFRGLPGLHPPPRAYRQPATSRRARLGARVSARPCQERRRTSSIGAAAQGGEWPRLRRRAIPAPRRSCPQDRRCPALATAPRCRRRYRAAQRSRLVSPTGRQTGNRPQSPGDRALTGKLPRPAFAAAAQLVQQQDRDAPVSGFREEQADPAGIDVWHQSPVSRARGTLPKIDSSAFRATLNPRYFGRGAAMHPGQSATCGKLKPQGSGPHFVLRRAQSSN